MQQAINDGADDLALSLDEYSEFINELEEQPRAWRRTADKEMDYADGNQLDSELLRKQAELGIPPAIEDLIGPALLSIQGYEATIRTDWRVTPDGEPSGQDIADALNYKLNKAERESKADLACSEAFRPQIGCGLGFVEVSRDSDPFNFPYRCLAVNRNEIDWDMAGGESDPAKWRYLRRRRWIHPKRIALAFPQHREIIETCGRAGPTWWQDVEPSTIDGGSSTGLQNAWNDGRAWTTQEERWYNPMSKELCLTEMWYRRWVNTPIIRTPDGRVVEYDSNNIAHSVAVISGSAKVQMATVTRVRISYWLGPYKLHDGQTPYVHRHFPYVPFWGFREDQTGVPFGYVRGMKYAQDSLNSGNSKLRWGMSVTRVVRTKGVVDMTDAQLRRQVARRDADIILNQEEMAKPGAKFEIERDYQLTEQHYRMLDDNRATIERVSNITSAFTGRTGTAKSGYQESQQVEQSNQSLAKIMESFRAGRSMVGELLLSMIVQDMGTNQHTIIIEGDAVKEDRTVIINAPERDPDTGYPYLSNDLQRTRLKVSLEDVPSTNSYRAQQLNAMAEAVKSLPSQYQAAMLPFMVSLMDVPFKREVVEAIRAAAAQESPEQINQRIKDAIKEALAQSGHDLKEREVAIKERKADSEIKEIDSRSVQIGVQAAFSAMQAGAQIAQMPMIAPVADVVMEGAGYKKPVGGGDDPNFPVASQTAAMNIKSPYIQGEENGGQLVEEAAADDVHKNTSPQFPPIPDNGASPMSGIETSTTADNLNASA